MNAQISPASLLNHPYNQAALNHLKALQLEPLPNSMPVLQLAQWAVQNQADQCTYQTPEEAELTLADWLEYPQDALNQAEESVRLDDLAEMEPKEAGVSLMLALTAPQA